MINLCNILLPNDKTQALLADIGKISKPKPVIDKVIEIDVVAMITIESTIIILCLEFYNFYISF